MSKLSLIRGALLGTLVFGTCAAAQAQPGMGPAVKATVVAEQAGEVYPETTKKYVASVEPIERADLVARVAGTLLARQRQATALGVAALAFPFATVWRCVKPDYCSICAWCVFYVVVGAASLFVLTTTGEEKRALLRRLRSRRDAVSKINGENVGKKDVA